MSLRSKKKILGAVWLCLSFFWLLNGIWHNANGGGRMAAIPISTAQEFQDIRMNPESDYILTADIDFEGFSYAPFGYYGGTFDFNGKTISNLTLSDPDGSAALFGSFNGTILGELHLENFNINGRSAAGFAIDAQLDSQTSFANWSVSGNITALNYSAGGLFNSFSFNSEEKNVDINNYSFIGTINSPSAVGGFAALVEFTDVNFNISNCNLSGAIIVGGYNVGGLFGILDANSLIITNCLSSGNISALSHAGGLVGSADITTSVSVEHCSFLGTIQVLPSEYQSHIGGLFGEINKGVFQDCICDVDIIGKSYIGGLCGNLGEGTLTNCSFNGTLSGCYALGSMCGSFNQVELTDCAASGAITGVIVDGLYPAYIGGLLGGESGVASLLRCTFSGEIAGNSYIGGLVSNVNSSGGSTENCHSEGVINLVSGSAPYGIGGLAGKFSGNISDCYSACTINTDSTCTSIGGLVGECEGNIERAYFSGDIAGDVYIGGLCGSFEGGSIKQCWAKGIYSGAHGIGCLVGMLGESALLENVFGMGSASGQDSIGGLVGAVYYPNATIITNAYAAALVAIVGGTKPRGVNRHF